MASLNGTITMQSGEYRPCLVHGKKALFHRWAEKENLSIRCDGHGSYDKFSAFEGMYAIVEFESGRTVLVDPREIQFLDSGNMFHERSMFFREETKE